MAGCPAVAFADGALPEVIEDGVTGYLVAVGDEAGLAAAIPRARQLDRTTIASRARSRLGLEPALDRYEHALGELTRGRRASRTA